MKRYAEPPSLAAEAYHVVRDRIFRGELVLGQSISRRKLAAELGMSFLPVSEALLRLEVEGLLESRPRAGTRVRIPTREDVRGLFVLRQALEGQAAMLFTRAAKPAERAELRKLGARVDALAAQPNRTLYIVLHHKLHRRIAEGARCATLCDAIEKAHAVASIWFCLLRKPLPQDQPFRHRSLANVLVDGTPEEAADAMRQHIASGLEHTLDVLTPYFRMRKDHGETFFRSAKKQQLQRIASSDADAVSYQTV